MGKRKVIIKKSVAENIARISWFVESKGFIASAERFSDSVYDFFNRLSDDTRSFAICRDPELASLDYKCITFRKKYTIVLLESETELTICEFISSKRIKW